MTLKGKTALITGSCGDGMGRCTALRLAAEGANIVLNYGTFRRGDDIRARGERVAAAVDELGGKALVQIADTTQEAEVKAMVEAAHNEFGAVDILVNNAGGPFNMRDYTDVPIDEWRTTLRAEIDGPFLMMKHLVPKMRERKWGRVIHLCAEGALRNAVSFAPDYFLGKAARGWMTLAFAGKEAQHGITVNGMEPGLTPFVAFDDALRLCRGEALDGDTTLCQPESDRVMWKGPYEERPGPTSMDIAESIAYLCSEKAKFVTGDLMRFASFPES
jgi:3-oxoacyl-[acyl-carrier protein] reductase